MLFALIVGLLVNACGPFGAGEVIYPDESWSYDAKPNDQDSLRTDHCTVIEGISHRNPYVYFADVDLNDFTLGGFQKYCK